MPVCVCVCVCVCVGGRPVLPDAPIVVVRAVAWFIINLFIHLLFYWYRFQIKWDHKEKFKFL
jgi:hypothetical protein